MNERILNRAVRACGVLMLSQSISHIIETWPIVSVNCDLLGQTARSSSGNPEVPAVPAVPAIRRSPAINQKRFGLYETS